MEPSQVEEPGVNIHQSDAFKGKCSPSRRGGGSLSSLLFLKGSKKMIVFDECIS